ncbi:MAG: hypothetical protein ABI781_04205 [Burkholderiales bacterium]
MGQLSPADQTRVQDAGRKSAVRMRELRAHRVEAARAAATKQVAVFTTMADHGPLISRMRPLHERYMAAPQTRSEPFTILANGTAASPATARGCRRSPYALLSVPRSCSGA